MSVQNGTKKPGRKEIIIGEAILNICSHKKEVSTQTVIEELFAMKYKKDETSLFYIDEAIGWLQKTSKLSVH